MTLRGSLRSKRPRVHLVEKRWRGDRASELRRAEVITYDLERARIRDAIERPLEKHHKGPSIEFSKLST